jgi:hypothetical protein
MYGQMTAGEIVEMKWSGRRFEQDQRNIIRLAAYKRKRAILDAVEESKTLPEHTADEMTAWAKDIDRLTAYGRKRRRAEHGNT